MRTPNSFSARFLTATVALSFALTASVTLAKGPAKVVEPTVDPSADESLPFEDVPGILRSARDWGLPPSVCYKHESIIDKSYAGGDSCSAKTFFGYACGATSTKVRRNKTWFEDYARRVEILQQSMTDPEKTIAAQKLGKFREEGRKAAKAGQTPKSFLYYLEQDSKERSQFRDLQDRAKNPKNADDEALQKDVDTKLQAGVQSEYGPRAAAALRKLQDIMAPRESLPGGVLDRQREAVLTAMKDQSTDQNSNFVRETFARMKKAIREVDIDNSLAAEYCFPGQHNTFFVRGTNGGRNKVVICPATLLSDNPSELAGSIATAMSHAIDPCAMDQLSAGSPAPGISLAGFLEPLRGCVAAKIARSKSGPAKNAIPEMTMPDGFAVIPVPESRRADYDKAVQNTADFQVQKGAPHCPAPFTDVELKKMTQFKGKEQVITDASENLNVLQRDQSNDGVAQFFADKAIAGYVASEPQTDKKAMLAETLAPYCDAFYNARGSSAPALEVLNNLVSSDPDISVLVCGSAKGSVAKSRTSSDKLAQSYFSGKNPPAKAQDKSCDLNSKLAMGAAAYVGMFPNMSKWGGGSALAFDPSQVALSSGAGGATGAQISAGASAGASAGVGTGSDAASGDKSTAGTGDAAGNTPGNKNDGAGNSLPAVTDYAATSTLASQLETRERAIDAALESEKANCRNIVTNGQFPFSSESQLVANDQTCNGTTSNRIDLNLFNPAHEVEGVAPGATNSKYKVRVGCQSRCLCNPARCYFPEPVYLGMADEPNPAPNKNAVTVAADVAHYLRDDESKGRFGIAAKACLKSAPVETSSVVTTGCANTSAAKDDKGRLVVEPRSKVTLLGEASSALLDFGCEFHCNCASPKGCGVVLIPPVVTAAGLAAIPTASADEIAKARAGKLDKSSKFSYLTPVGFTVPRVTVAVGSGSGPSGGSTSGSTSDSTSSAVITDWTRYEKNGKATEPPKPTAVLASRNQARMQTDTLAVAACSGPTGALTKEYDARKKQKPDADPKKKTTVPQTQYEVFCPQKAATPPSEFLIEPIAGGVETKTSHKIVFQYKCLYSCADGLAYADRARVSYSGQTPSSDKVTPLDTPESREQARLADFALYRTILDKACKDGVTPSAAIFPNPKSLEIAQGAVTSKVLSSCADSNPKKTAGPISIEETTTYASNFTGDVSHAPLPYSCTYQCNCQTNACSGAKAVLVSPKNGEDLNGVTGLNRNPPGALEVVKPTEKEAQDYERVATSKCLEQGKSIAANEVSCKSNGVPGKGPEVFLAGAGNILKFSCMYPCSCTGKTCSIDASKVFANGGPEAASAVVAAPSTPTVAARLPAVGSGPVTVAVGTAASPEKVGPVASGSVVATTEVPPVAVATEGGTDSPATVDPEKIAPAVWSEAAGKCRDLPNPSETLFASTRMVAAANGCTGTASPPQPLLTDQTVTATDPASKSKYEFQCRYLCTCNLLKEFKAGGAGGKKVCLSMPADKARAAVSLVKVDDKDVVVSSDGTGKGVPTATDPATPPPAKPTADGAVVLKPVWPNAKPSKSFTEVEDKIHFYRDDTDMLLGVSGAADCTATNPQLANPEKNIDPVYFTRACENLEDGKPTKVLDPRSANALETKSPNGNYRYTCAPSATCKNKKAVIDPPASRTYDTDVSFPYAGACQKVMYGASSDCKKPNEKYSMSVAPKKGISCNYSCFCNAGESQSLCDLASIANIKGGPKK